MESEVVSMHKSFIETTSQTGGELIMESKCILDEVKIYEAILIICFFLYEHLYLMHDAATN